MCNELIRYTCMHQGNDWCVWRYWSGENYSFLKPVAAVNITWSTTLVELQMPSLSLSLFLPPLPVSTSHLPLNILSPPTCSLPSRYLPSQTYHSDGKYAHLLVIQVASLDDSCTVHDLVPCSSCFAQSRSVSVHEYYLCENSPDLSQHNSKHF